MAMTRHQYLLCKIAEEAAELGQRALKAQQFGATEIQANQPLTNYERMRCELLDLLCWFSQLDELLGARPVSYMEIEAHYEHVQGKQAAMLELARTCGMVNR